MSPRGQVCYEAWGRHLVHADPLPEWDKLPPETQAAWDAAAAQVEARFAAQFRDVIEAVWSASRPLVTAAAAAMAAAGRHEFQGGGGGGGGGTWQDTG